MVDLMRLNKSQVQQDTLGLFYVWYYDWPFMANLLLCTVKKLYPCLYYLLCEYLGCGLSKYYLIFFYIVH